MLLRCFARPSTEPLSFAKRRRFYAILGFAPLLLCCSERIGTTLLLRHPYRLLAMPWLSDSLLFHRSAGRCNAQPVRVVTILCHANAFRISPMPQLRGAHLFSAVPRRVSAWTFCAVALPFDAMLSHFISHR